MLSLHEKISEKTNYCIKKKDLEEYSELRKQLEDEKTNFYKIQKDLHYEYQKNIKIFRKRIIQKIMKNIKNL